MKAGLNTLSMVKPRTGKNALGLELFGVNPMKALAFFATAWLLSI
jgi:hypothetical protein